MLIGEDRLLVMNFLLRVLSSTTTTIVSSILWNSSFRARALASTFMPSFPNSKRVMILIKGTTCVGISSALNTPSILKSPAHGESIYVIPVRGHYYSNEMQVGILDLPKEDGGALFQLLA